MDRYIPCKECGLVEKRDAECLMVCFSNIIEALRTEMKAGKDWLPFFPEGKANYTDGFGFTGKGQVKE